MAWELFQWGSRGLWYKTGVEGIYMAHIFSPDGIRVVIQGQGTELQELINTLHVQSPNSPPDYSDCLAVANTVSAWVTNFYRNMWPLTIQCEQVVATAMNAVPAAQALVVNTQVGTRSGTAWDNSLTLCCKTSGHTNGRRRRGRMYPWPGVTTDAVASVATAAYQTAIVGTLSTLMSQLSASGYIPVIWSPTDGALYPITTVSALDRVLDVQRRRSPGRGR